MSLKDPWVGRCAHWYPASWNGRGRTRCCELAGESGFCFNHGDEELRAQHRDRRRKAEARSIRLSDGHLPCPACRGTCELGEHIECHHCTDGTMTVAEVADYERHQRECAEFGGF